MWANVIETFRCIAKARRNMPGMAVEDVLGNATADDIYKELAFLESMAPKDHKDEPKAPNVTRDVSDTELFKELCADAKKAAAEHIRATTPPAELIKHAETLGRTLFILHYRAPEIPEERREQHQAAINAVTDLLISAAEVAHGADRPVALREENARLRQALVDIKQVNKEVQAVLDDANTTIMATRHSHKVLARGIKRVLGLEHWPDFNALYGATVTSAAEGMVRLLLEKVNKLEQNQVPGIKHDDQANAGTSSGDTAEIAATGPRND